MADILRKLDGTEMHQAARVQKPLAPAKLRKLRKLLGLSAAEHRRWLYQINRLAG